MSVHHSCPKRQTDTELRGHRINGEKMNRHRITPPVENQLERAATAWAITTIWAGVVFTTWRSARTARNSGRGKLFVDDVDRAIPEGARKKVKANMLRQLFELVDSILTSPFRHSDRSDPQRDPPFSDVLLDEGPPRACPVCSRACGCAVEHSYESVGLTHTRNCHIGLPCLSASP